MRPSPRILIILIALILVIGGGIWWFSAQKSGTPDEQTNGNTNTNVTVRSTGVNSPEIVEVQTPPDTDSDGLSDQKESELGTKINAADSDSDGLSDYDEVTIYKTNPLRADTDGDGFTDGDEVAKGFNPNGAGPLFDTQQAITNSQNN